MKSIRFRIFEENLLAVSENLFNFALVKGDLDILHINSTDTKVPE